MSLKKEILSEGQFCSFIKVLNYEMLEDSDGVILIPILSETKRVGIRHEYCPPYMMGDGKERNWYTVISGKIEKGEYKSETAKRELYEEAGIKYSKNDNIVLIAEDLPIWKSLSNRLTIYLINIYEPEVKYVAPPGDGTENEAKSKTIWVTREELVNLIATKNCDLPLHMVTSMIERIV